MMQAEFGVLYKGYPIETLKILLDHGADVDEAVVSPEDIAGFTPLMFAVRDNHEELAKLLIAKGANVNVRANNGKTPLSLAVEKGYTAMAELLKSAGGE
jgi:ankyrin repeat protein